jgi:hypothetical protein
MNVNKDGRAAFIKAECAVTLALSHLYIEMDISFGFKNVSLWEVV